MDGDKKNEYEIDKPIEKWAKEFNRSFTEKEIKITNKHMKG